MSCVVRIASKTLPEEFEAGRLIDAFSHVAQRLLDATLFMPSASNSFYKGFRSVGTSRLGTF